MEDYERLLLETLDCVNRGDFARAEPLIREIIFSLPDPPEEMAARYAEYLLEIAKKIDLAREAARGISNAPMLLRRRVRGWRSDLLPSEFWPRHQPPATSIDVLLGTEERLGGSLERPTPAEATQWITRTPHMRFAPDPPLAPGSSFQLTVYVDRRTADAGEDSTDLLVEAGSEVEVHLAASSHFSLLSEQVQTFVVSGEEASEAPPFRLKVRSADALRRDITPVITAFFFYNGVPSGKVTRKVQIAGLPVIAAGASGAPSRLELQDAKPPDLLITITLGEENDGRHFHLRLSGPLFDRYKKPDDDKALPWILPASAKDIVYGHMQGFTASATTPSELIAKLRGAGIELFKSTPKRFQDFFWELVDKRTLPGQIGIVSEEPYIPWELMVPSRKTAASTEERDFPLGVEFPVGRWLPPDFVAARPKIPLVDSFVIAPKYSGKMVLKFSDTEQELVLMTVAGDPIAPATFDHITQQLTAHGRSLIHFICHGKDSLGPSQIVYLENGKELTSSMLLGIKGLRRIFEAKRPFVFLNACEVGRATPALTGLGGFASSFIDLGAAAVIAPLWSVKDEFAFRVAAEFYHIVWLQPATPFAEIMRRLRAKAYADAGAEDTYAAYCFYGDPRATR